MTDKTIIEEALKRKNWTREDWKTSKDPIDRLVYFISYLSPHNLWKAREAVWEQLTLAEKRGEEKAIAHATKLIEEYAVRYSEKSILLMDEHYRMWAREHNKKLDILLQALKQSQDKGKA